MVAGSELQKCDIIWLFIKKMDCLNLLSETNLGQEVVNKKVLGLMTQSIWPPPPHFLIFTVFVVYDHIANNLKKK